MSQAPVWITESGSLGVVPEGKFYRVELQAYDPDFPNDPTKVTYSLIAGALPEGVQVDTSGTIEGIPISVADFKGVPQEVAENTTSKFAIRVTDEDGRIADRTFTLTVTGQDKPYWITPEGEIGEYFDGDQVDFQFEADDVDPVDTVEISLAYGKLPKGLTLDPDGRLHGYILPESLVDQDAVSGYDRSGNEYDEYPYDFRTRSSSLNYEFTLQATDGKDIVTRTFSIFVFSRSAMTADTIEITADNGVVTSDSVNIRSPYIENIVSDIGRYRHDNYFAYKFDGRDPAGEIVLYYIDFGTLPEGITLDEDTGWLHGDLPDIGLTEETYTFGVRVKKFSEDIYSTTYTVSMTVYGNIDTGVQWLTDPDLGTIDNGAISTLKVEAYTPNAELKYRIKSGSIIYSIPDTTADTDTVTADSDAGMRIIEAYVSGSNSKLPQGLTLTEDGNIIGRVSFNMFTLDGGTTTFEEDFETRLVDAPTTFDRTFTFTVEAYSIDESVSITREFTILVNREYEIPYNVLYCQALPPREDRALIEELLTNEEVIPTNVIYRPEDPNFGVADEVIYYHAYGLTPAALEDYYNALTTNHYNKKLVLGEIKTARALDQSGEILYEVVYSQLIDDLVNEDGESVSPSVDLEYPAIDDGVSTTTVYPNSLENMREQVVDQIGIQSKVLPRWMLSKQDNGEVLGFTPAWVIAYTLPNKSKFLQYRIQEFYGTQLNLVDFEIDRYTLDSQASRFWGLTSDTDRITADNANRLASDDQRWKVGVSTTFDRTETTSDSTQVTADDDRYTIDTWVQADQPALPDGYEPRDPGEYGNEYETLFDGGGTRFTSPVDTYSDTDEFNSYVKFPDEQIINNEQ